MPDDQRPEETPDARRLKLSTVEVDWSDGIATVTLLKKTMNVAFFDDLGQVFSELVEDSSLRAVIICSSAPNFSYGLDLVSAFRDHGNLFAGGGLAGPRTELLGLIRKWQAAFGAPATIEVPVIAALHGWCVGGGLDLASACDIRLCSADARFSLREARIAIVADLGSLQRLPGIIGQGHTRELAFTAKDIAATYFATCALLDDDTVKCWGGNDYGELGQGHLNELGAKPEHMGDALLRVDLGTGRTVQQLVGSGSGFCALLDDDTLKCWGWGWGGWPGQGSEENIGDDPNEMGDNLLPIDLGTGVKPVKLSHSPSAWGHVCAQLDNLELKCWGVGDYGALGNGDRESRGDEPGEMGDNLPYVDLGTK